MKKLDVYVANLMTGYVLLHNLHWNVRGFSFKGVHEYLEERYDAVTAAYDEVAELQKQLGYDPKASLKDYLELTTVQELDSKDISDKDAIKEAKKYYELMKDLALEIRDETDEFLVANLMEDHIADFTKNLWFMDSMLK